MTVITQAAFIRWLEVFADYIAAEKDHLTELDSAIGDADHGINMARGFQAVLLKLPTLADLDIGAICKAVGMTLISTVGGASGPLYGTLFLQMGAETGGKQALSLAEWAAAFAAAVQGVQRRGKALPGDKTMLDCLLPAVTALNAAADQGLPLDQALNLAEQAARQGMLATIPLTARKGRASYLGERSAGHQDPGATSAHMLLQAAVQAWG